MMHVKNFDGVGHHPIKYLYVVAAGQNDANFSVWLSVARSLASVRCGQ